MSDSSTPALALLLSIVSTPSGAHGWTPAFAWLEHSVRAVLARNGVGHAE
jgi:hypothetical protein